MFVVERITVIKFGVNDKGSNGTGILDRSFSFPLPFVYEGLIQSYSHTNLTIYGNARELFTSTHIVSAVGAALSCY